MNFGTVVADIFGSQSPKNIYENKCRTLKNPANTVFRRVGIEGPPPITYVLPLFTDVPVFMQDEDEDDKDGPKKKRKSKSRENSDDEGKKKKKGKKVRSPVPSPVK